MGKKVFDKILLVLVILGSIGFTWYIANGNMDTMIYNFIFLGIMVLVVLIGMIAGFGRMGSLERDLRGATEEVDRTFGGIDAIAGDVMALPEQLFLNEHLNEPYQDFLSAVHKSQSGLVDVEDFINDDEIDGMISKRLIELIPDILTSLGILGTFIGLVIGLKGFEPSNYEAMTSSVSALVDGIKVAFLTSIYGISLSLVFGYGTRVSYGSLMDSLNRFLDRFHNMVVPSAEMEARNIMVNYQEEQTKAIARMTDQFSEHLATSFEKVITPSFRKMNQSMDILTETMSKGQEALMKGVLEDFLQKMNDNFKMQFADFNQALEDMTNAQKRMMENTKELYNDLSAELTRSYTREDANMRSLVREMGAMQKEYITSAQQTMDNNQRYSETLDNNYRQVVNYMQDAEQSSAKFWVACNQAMQKYVSAASVSVEGFAAASKHNSALYEANEKVVESYNARMQEFAEYQKMTAQTMEQVQNLLYNIVTSPDDTHRTNIRNMAVNNSNRDLLLDIQRTIAEQGERQEELLETIAGYMKENARSSKKSKGLFSRE